MCRSIGLATRGQPGAAVSRFMDFALSSKLLVPPTFLALPVDGDVSEKWLLAAGFGELLDALKDVQNRLGQRQAASLFEDGNQFVEFGAGVRSRDNDANGVEQFFAFCS